VLSGRVKHDQTANISTYFKNILYEEKEERDHWGDQDVDRRIILS
jgi:hypothetical protein